MRNLLLAAEAAERDATQQLLPHLLGRPESRSGLLGVDRARRDRVHTNPMTCPLHRERPREVHDAGLCRGGVHGAGAARPRVRRNHVHDLGVVPTAVRDAPPELARAMKGAVEDDAHNGAPPIRRQLLGPNEEVTGSVVHQGRQRT